MSTLEIQNQIRQSPVFKTGEPFYLNQLSIKNTHSKPAIKEAVKELVRSRELTPLEGSMYKSQMKCAPLAHGPWRTLTNEQVLDEAFA